MKQMLALLGVFVLVGGGCWGADPVEESSDAEIDRDSILFEAREKGLIMDEPEVEQMAQTALEQVGTSLEEGVEKFLDLDVRSWNSGALADVTGGESFGLVYARYENGRFTLISKLGNLPALGDAYFYEGWLVRRGEQMSVVSTGRIVEHEDNFINVFESPVDLSDHAFYVVTLEPVDGDPAPAEHILEGTIK